MVITLADLLKVNQNLLPKFVNSSVGFEQFSEVLNPVEFASLSMSLLAMDTPYAVTIFNAKYMGYSKTHIFILTL